MNQALAVLAVVFFVLGILSFMMRDGYGWTVGLVMACLGCLVALVVRRSQ